MNANIEVKNGSLEVNSLIQDESHWDVQRARASVLAEWVRSERRKKEAQERFEAQQRAQQPQDRSIKNAARALMVQNTQHKRVVL